MNVRFDPDHLRRRFRASVELDEPLRAQLVSLDVDPSRIDEVVNHDASLDPEDIPRLAHLLNVELQSRGEARAGRPSRLGQAEAVYSALVAAAKRQGIAATVSPGEVPGSVAARDAIVAAAVREDADFHQARQRIDVARERARLAHSGSNRAVPDVQLSVGTTPSLSATWRLGLWQRDQSRQAIAEFEVRAREYDLEAVANRIEATVATKLAEVDVAHARLATAQGRLRHARRVRHEVEAAVRSQDLDPAARSAAAAEVARAEFDLNNHQRAYGRALTELRSLLPPQYANVVLETRDVGASNVAVEDALSMTDAEIEAALARSPALRAANERLRAMGVSTDDVIAAQQLLSNLNVSLDPRTFTIGAVADILMHSLNGRARDAEIGVAREQAEAIAASYYDIYQDAFRDATTLRDNDARLQHAERDALAVVRRFDAAIAEAQQRHPGVAKAQQLAGLASSRQDAINALIDIRADRARGRTRFEALTTDAVGPHAHGIVDEAEIAGFDAAPGALEPVSEEFEPEERRNWLEKILDAIAEAFAFLVPGWDIETDTFDRPDIIKRDAHRIWNDALTRDERRQLRGLVQSEAYRANRAMYVDQLAESIRTRPSYVDSSEQAREDAEHLLEALEVIARRDVADELPSDIVGDSPQAEVVPAPRAPEPNVAEPRAAEPRALEPDGPPPRVPRALEHTVLPKQTLGGIASHYGTSLALLVAINPQIENTWRLMPADRVKLPPPDLDPARERDLLAGVHVVQRGATLAGVARAHGTTVRAIRERNPHLVGLSRLIPGDVLRMPAATTALAFGTDRRRGADPAPRAPVDVSDTELISAEVGRTPSAVDPGLLRQTRDELQELFDVYNTETGLLSWTNDIGDDRITDEYVDVLLGLRSMNEREATAFLSDLSDAELDRLVRISIDGPSLWSRQQGSPVGSGDTALHVFMSKVTDGEQAARVVSSWRDAGRHATSMTDHQAQAVALGRSFLDRLPRPRERQSFIEALAPTIDDDGRSLQTQVGIGYAHSALMADPSAVLVAVALTGQRRDPAALATSVARLKADGKLDAVIAAALSQGLNTSMLTTSSMYPGGIPSTFSDRSPSTNPGLLVDLLDAVVAGDDAQTRDDVLGSVERALSDRRFRGRFPKEVVLQLRNGAYARGAPALAEEALDNLQQLPQGASVQERANAIAALTFAVQTMAPDDARSFLATMSPSDRADLIEAFGQIEGGPQMLADTIARAADPAVVQSLVHDISRAVDDGRFPRTGLVEVGRALIDRTPPLASEQKLRLIRSLAADLDVRVRTPDEHTVFDPRGVFISELLTSMRGEGRAFRRGLEMLYVRTGDRVDTRALDAVARASVMPEGRSTGDQEPLLAAVPSFNRGRPTNDVSPLVDLIDATAAHGHAEHRALVLRASSKAVRDGVSAHQRRPVWAAGFGDATHRVTDRLVALLGRDTGNTIDALRHTDPTGEGLTLLFTMSMGPAEWSELYGDLDDPASGRDPFTTDAPNPFDGRFNQVYAHLRRGEGLQHDPDAYWWFGDRGTRHAGPEGVNDRQARERLAYFEGARVGSMRVLEASVKHDFSLARNARNTELRVMRELASYTSLVTDRYKRVEFLKSIGKVFEVSYKLYMHNAAGEAVVDNLDQRRSVLHRLGLYRETWTRRWYEPSRSEYRRHAGRADDFMDDFRSEANRVSYGRDYRADGHPVTPWGADPVNRTRRAADR